MLRIFNLMYRNNHMHIVICHSFMQNILIDIDYPLIYFCWSYLFLPRIAILNAYILSSTVYDYNWFFQVFYDYRVTDMTRIGENQEVKQLLLIALLL